MECPYCTSGSAKDLLHDSTKNENTWSGYEIWIWIDNLLNFETSDCNGNGVSKGIEINFCPMCGRCLHTD